MTARVNMIVHETIVVRERRPPCALHGERQDSDEHLLDASSAVRNDNETHDDIFGGHGGLSLSVGVGRRRLLALDALRRARSTGSVHNVRL